MNAETDTSSGGSMSGTEARILDVKLSQVRDDVKGFKDDLRDIKRVLENLVRIEEQQRDFRETFTRAFTEIGLNRDRLTKVEKLAEKIESELPAYRELRRWVIGGVLAGLGMMGGALIDIVFIHPAKTRFEDAPTMMMPQQPQQSQLPQYRKE